MQHNTILSNQPPTVQMTTLESQPKLIVILDGDAVDYQYRNQELAEMLEDF